MKRRKGRKIDSQAGRKREGAWSQESPRSRVSAREPEPARSPGPVQGDCEGPETATPGSSEQEPQRGRETEPWTQQHPRGRARGAETQGPGDRAGAVQHPSATVPVTPTLSPGSAQGPAAAQPSTAGVTAGPSPLRPQGPWKSLCPSSSFRCRSLRGIPASYITGV